MTIEVEERIVAGRNYEFVFDDDEEQVMVRMRKSGAWIIGMNGPLDKASYPEIHNEKLNKIEVDKAAKRVINEIVHAYHDFGYEKCWSEDFPINKYFNYEGFCNLATFMAEKLRYYLVPSGENGEVVLGDITVAVERCLKEEVDKEISVRFSTERRHLGTRAGTLWKNGKDYIINIDEKDDYLGPTFIEGHEAGHLMFDYAKELLK